MHTHTLQCLFSVLESDQTDIYSTQGEGDFLPEKRDKELNQIHEVTVLGKGNLKRKGEKTTG